MTSNETLKPCPFCGSTNLTVNDYLVSLTGKHVKGVECRNCGSVGPTEKDVATWNTSPPLQDAAPDLLAACEEFVRKCECGEARSVRSYAQMKAAIAKAKGEVQP